MTLDEAKHGQVVRVVQTRPELALRPKVQAIGLRAGREVRVMSRNGRMLLVQVGEARVAVTADLARCIEVQ
ncbi:MAG: FeoA family protein [Anaerolineae bacterium]|nr:ferrous iron transport protein A [Thermoflexales bacterium]MDW8396664.1 FeoA family protein [Anaerolineae bacterium]